MTEYRNLSTRLVLTPQDAVALYTPVSRAKGVSLCIEREGQAGVVYAAATNEAGSCAHLIRRATRDLTQAAPYRVQVGIGAADAHIFYRVAYRAQALAPLLIAVGLVQEGAPNAALLGARDAQSLIARHFVQVSQTKMASAYAAPKVQRGFGYRYNELPERLRTRDNYRLAESCLASGLHVVERKVVLKGAAQAGAAQAGAAQAGAAQAGVLVLVAGALVAQGPTARRFDDLLADYGFRGVAADHRHLFERAHRYAARSAGRTLDIEYGRHPLTYKNLRLKDFAREVAALTVQHYAPAQEMIRDELTAMTRMFGVRGQAQQRSGAVVVKLQAAAGQAQGEAARGLPMSGRSARGEVSGLQLGG